MKNQNPASKIWSNDQIVSKVNEIKSQGKSIVFTNGCFDIIHAGHVKYLAETAELADFLIVAVNSDESVKRMEKSPARPLQNEFSRSHVMASFAFVDAVIIFNEDTPKEVIEIITPNILVKGGDYTLENIVGAHWVIQNGGQVKTIDFLPGYSTSAIEQKILLSHK
jgi:rfaE bifunctional protein nucleotidyltransferase chain/domain